MQPEGERAAADVCDCLIIGAGLVGCAAALALAARGLSVTMFERRAQLTREQMTDERALVLAAASVSVLDDLGVWPRLAPRACPIRTIRVTDRGGFGGVDLSAQEINRDALGWSYPAHSLLGTLIAAVLENPRIRVQWSTRFCNYDTSTRGVIEIRAEHGNRPVTQRARLLIGADGAGSAVRAASGIGIDELDYAQQAIVARVEATRPRPHTAFEHFTRRGPLALIPTGGAGYISVQCLDEEAAAAALALDDHDYLMRLEQRFGSRLGRFSQLGPRRAHALRRQRAQALTARRTVLLGNAANTLHPNAAQGLNLGLRDVATLAGILTREPDGTAADPGVDELLQRYASARTSDHRRVGTFTDLLAQTFRSRLLPVVFARRAGLGVLAHAGPLRRRLIRDASGLGLLGGLTAAD